jgi:uncharacterized membrane protein
MRQLQLRVPVACLARARAIADRCGASSTFAIADPTEEGLRGDDAAAVLLLLELPNRAVGGFVEAIGEEIAHARIVLQPQGIVPLDTPIGEIDDQVRDVSRVSTLELVLGSLQSIGSWRGLILYSVVAGLIGVYGVIFDVAYLLVAAMLVNPMGAPALVSVIGMTIGERRMFARGGLRFAASLGIQATTALAFGYAYRIDVATAMMEQIASLSSWAAVVAAGAGAAGALALVNAERDSLVSGTAAGFMVAAALAPPTAVLGLAIPLQRWDYAGLMALLLALQFTAIGLGGWLALTIYGVGPDEASARRGSPRGRTIMLFGVAVATVVLVAVQLLSQPATIRADLSRRGLQAARDAVTALGAAELVQASAEFVRGDVVEEGYEGLLLRLVVAGRDDQAASETAERVRSEVRRLISERMSRVVPFVVVEIVPPGEERDR